MQKTLHKSGFFLQNQKKNENGNTYVRSDTMKPK